MFVHDICRHCFQVTHNRGICPIDTKVIACTNCYRLNFFTTNCPCSKPVFDPPQALRMCGTTVMRPFIDVQILAVNVPALVNTTLTQTVISFQVASHVLGLLSEDLNIPSQIEVPFGRGQTVVRLMCKVRNFHQPDTHIHLGMDYLNRQHFRFKSGNVTLYGQSRWSTDHPDRVQFAYDAPYGRHLRARLLRLDYPMLSGYARPPLPDGNRRTYFSRFRDAPRR